MIMLFTRAAWREPVKLIHFSELCHIELTAGIEFLKDEAGGKNQSGTLKAYNCASKTKSARAIAQLLEIDIT